MQTGAPDSDQRFACILRDHKVAAGQSVGRQSPRRARRAARELVAASSERSMSIATATLDRLRALVGPHGYLDQPTDLEPFLVDHRKLYRGATPLVLRPDTTAQVAAIMKLCNDARLGVVPVGGNTSYCGGATPERRRLADRAVARAHAAHPLARSAQLRDDRRSRVRAGRDPGCRGLSRSPVSDEPRLGRLVPARRQSVDERRRHRGPALRHDARPRARTGSRAAGWPRARRPQAAAQGQHRLRPARSVHRRRRHARRHHRRSLQTLLSPCVDGDRIRRRRRSAGSRRAAVAIARRSPAMQ